MRHREKAREAQAPINLIIDVHYGASQVNGHVKKPSAILEW